MLKYESSKHNIAFSSIHLIISSEPGNKYAQFKHHLAAKLVLHLPDTFIQSDLQCIKVIHVLSVCVCVRWELNPWPFALLMQCSTTEPQEHYKVLNLYVSRFWFEMTTGDGLFHWRKRYYELWTHVNYEPMKQQFEFCFLQTCSFSLHQTSVDGLESWGLLVNYWDVFISCLYPHSDGTHSLQRNHWWESDVMHVNNVMHVILPNLLW